MSKERAVSAIEQGTVIDHIPAGNALKIVNLLKLGEQKRKMTIGLHLSSKSIGHKDLIKIEGPALTEHECSQVAIFAPLGTVSIIENYKVIKKFRVNLPARIEGVFTCPTLTCITNHEDMKRLFIVEKKVGKVELACFYCQKNFSYDPY